MTREQTDGDLISRQAVKDLFCRICMESNLCYRPKETCEDLKLFDKLPSVRPQPKTGHWVDIDEEPHEVWECDHCGFVIDGSGCIDPYDYRDTYNFCPNCGADMRGTENDKT